MPPGEVLGEGARDVGVNHVVLEVGEGNLEVEAEGVRQTVFGDRSLVDQHRSELRSSR